MNNLTETENTGARKVVVGLLSHYFKHENLGCVALSVGNIMLMDEAARKAGVTIEYRVLVNEKAEVVPIDFTESRWSYASFPSTKASIKRPWRLLRSDAFETCDLVVNINGGDGFTDIYGLPRLLSELYMSRLALSRDLPVILAPQTIGPFKARLSRIVAGQFIQRCEIVFTRDQLSTKVAKGLAPESMVTEVMDVAFSLPYESGERPQDRLNIGINVSGLLYRGGYNGRNYFGLNFDYADFIHESVRVFLQRGHRVHLVAHVLADPSSVEDDYSACIQVQQRHPQAVVAPRFQSPIDAKSYIAGMDFFTGARMHSTIGAFSSGVPVVPIAYSDKLGGLYDALRYPYYLDARGEWTVESAVAQLMEWAVRREELRSAAVAGQLISDSRTSAYVAGMATLFAKFAR